MKNAAFLAAIAASASTTMAATLSPQAMTGALSFIPAGKPSPVAGNCPANAFQPDGKLLPGNATVPTSLQVPISAKYPTTAFPASDWAIITPNDFCTVFNLVLKADATAGKICTLVFDFPQASQGPAPYAYRYQGPGHFTFTGYALDAGAVAGQTTFNKPPASGPNPPNPPAVLAPGNSYVINSAPCPPIAQIFPGKTEITVSGSLCSTDSTLIFRKGEGQCPLGFYVELTDDPAQ